MTGQSPIDWLLVPGWGFSAAVFAPLQAALRPHLNVETVACPDAAVWIDARVADVRAGRQRPFGICGWSLGAIIALERSVGCPDAVHDLVMLGATPRFVASRDWSCAMDADAFAAFSALASRSTTLAQARLAILSAMGEAEPAAVQRSLRATFDRPVSAADAGAHDLALRNGLDHLGTVDLRPVLPSCRARVTLVHGSRDALVPLEAARMMLHSLPSARLIEVPDGGHAFFVPRIRLVADILMARVATSPANLP